tara:strand:+ start:1167 stop:1796 length:630 start_codon:yes stop_codon:yes gene_type:complete
MHRVGIFSDDQVLVKLWSHALIRHFDVFTASKTPDLQNAIVAIVDSKKIDADEGLIGTFAYTSTRLLIAGKGWSENKQINALVHGAAGYCGESEPPKLLLQAVDSVIKGDIWIQRHLVPRIIGTLVKMKPDTTEPNNTSKTIESSALLATLSTRELDVANMIRVGENNKAIAETLAISERTVKAHLTSIFKKLNVPDRLHLALYIKEYS